MITLSPHSEFHMIILSLLSLQLQLLLHQDIGSSAYITRLIQ